MFATCTTLHAHANDIRDFVDDLLLTHAGITGAHVTMDGLGACFGLAAGPDEELTLAPSPSRAHPEGALTRNGVAGRLFPLDDRHPAVLAMLLPARFVAAYKAVIAGHAAAIRLAFSGGPEAMPSLYHDGVVDAILSVLIEPGEIDVFFACGSVVLKVV